jgi:TonB-dependent SusC/RagA subfamily outer membrane receptor
MSFCSHRTLIIVAAGLAMLVSGCRPARLSASRAPLPDIQRVSMGPSTDVLYVLDGHVLARAATDSAGMPSAVRSLDPSHIVSIQVLKGAKARKQYGEAGASGVVVITTSRTRS